MVPLACRLSPLHPGYVITVCALVSASVVMTTNSVDRANMLGETALSSRTISMCIAELSPGRVWIETGRNKGGYGSSGRKSAIQKRKTHRKEEKQPLKTEEDWTSAYHHYGKQEETVSAQAGWDPRRKPQSTTHMQASSIVHEHLQSSGPLGTNRQAHWQGSRCWSWSFLQVDKQQDPGNATRGDQTLCKRPGWPAVH